MMKKLKVYFTSDVHGNVYSTDYRNRERKTRGLLNMAGEIRKDENTLVIDGGDMLQGSPFVTYLSDYFTKEGTYPGQDNTLGFHPLAKVLNKMEYDYITLGNHDFNYGYDYLRSYTEALNARCLCTNVKDRTGGVEILPYDMKTMGNGMVVGIIGCTTEFIPVWERPENLENFTVDPVIPSLEESVNRLRDQVDVLIGIYHGGFEKDVRTHEILSDTNENLAYEICKSYPFDLLLTGHQHMEIEGERLHGTYIVQPPAQGEKYCEVSITFDDSNEKTRTKITSSLVTPKGVIDEILFESLLPIEKKVQQWLDAPIGYLDKPLGFKDHLTMALEGSDLANFINQIQLEVSNAEVSCTSFGNSIKGFEEKVTVRDIVSTYVYPNTLVVLEITGEMLGKALERSAEYFKVVKEGIQVSDSFLKPKVAHYNYDYFSNVYYSFDLRKAPGDRVFDVKIKGKPLNLEKTYTMVMNNYRATGVGGYEFYREGKVIREISVEMPELIIQYFNRYDRIVVDRTRYLVDIVL